MTVSAVRVDERVDEQFDQQLLTASNEALISRAVQGSVFYPVTTFLLVLITDWRTSNLKLGLLLFLLTAVAGAIRFVYLRRLLRSPESYRNRHPRLLTPILLSPAICFGVFVGSAITVFGLVSTTSIVCIMLVLGFTAGGTSSLAMNRKIHLIFLTVMLLPFGVIAFITSGSSGFAIALMAAGTLLFLRREGATAGDAFFGHFQKGFELQKAVSTLEVKQGELVEVNNSMRLVLDNIEQGLCVIDTAGVIQSHGSQAFDRWFGTANPGERFAERLGDQAFGEWFEMTLEMLVDDFLPAECVLDQLPKVLLRNGQHLSFAYKLIEHDDKIEGLLVMINDMTEQVATQESEREQRELVHLFQLLARDPDGFQEFRTSAMELVEQITEAHQSRNEQIRALHTLKGNSAVMGVESLAALCHDLEDELTKIDFALEVEQAQRLTAAWTEIDQRMGTILGERVDVLELSDAEHEQIINMIEAHQPYEKLLKISSNWRLESVPRRFERMASQARRAAKTLDKDVEVKVEVAPLRLDADVWREFWMACVHLMRNSVDHGIEDRETRIARNKRPVGLLVLSAQHVGDEVVVKVRDDGEGINWEKVAQKAKSLRLPHDSEADLIKALFSDGMSTREIVTATSGRGVGLGALAHATTKMGGTIEVASTPGRGSVFTVRIPYNQRGAVSASA